MGRLRRVSRSRKAPTSGVFDAEPMDLSIDLAVAVPSPRRRNRISRPLAVAMLPVATVALTAGAAWLKWQWASDDDLQAAATESVRTASEVTVALLSYSSATADHDLRAARDRLTGTFRDAYSSLIDEVVIPGAKQKQIFSTAAVPAASLVSVARSRSVVLVFVDQSTIMGSGAPTQTESSIRVTLDRIGSSWLVSDFVPIR